ncbi:FAD/NAD(P)-binding protein [Kitasatospora sp. NPDC048239]|uniref:FAD/NAD(P)-binding protein n=1 Tax=Kitasatospora sp. NPDC048239 TaxID=3364046 RepID=UPI00371A9FC9
MVAVVGLGVAGSLAAVHLCDGASNHPQGVPIELLLVDPGLDAGVVGPAPDPGERRLETPAEDLSCFDGDAEHFARWLCRRGECPSRTDLPPSWYRYRTYLAHTVGESIIQANGIATVRRIRSRVEQFGTTDESGVVLYLDSGEVCRVDSVVMATGPRWAWARVDGDRWMSRPVDGGSPDAVPCCAQPESRDGEMEVEPPVYSLSNCRDTCSSGPAEQVSRLRREAETVAAAVLAGKAS